MNEEDNGEDVEWSEGNKINMNSIDDLACTSIEVSCYRETGRLVRVLDVFRKAMTLASRDGNHRDLNNNLKKLHDHKGELTATWISASECMRLKRYVEEAWEDECEWDVKHETLRGVVIAHTELTGKVTPCSKS